MQSITKLLPNPRNINVILRHHDKKASLKYCERFYDKKSSEK